MTALQWGGVAFIVVGILKLVVRLMAGFWVPGFHDGSEHLAKEEDKVYRDSDSELFVLNATASTVSAVAIGVALLVLGEK